MRFQSTYSLTRGVWSLPGNLHHGRPLHLQGPQWGYYRRKEHHRHVPQYKLIERETRRRKEGEKSPHSLDLSTPGRSLSKRTFTAKQLVICGRTYFAMNLLHGQLHSPISTLFTVVQWAKHINLVPVCSPRWGHCRLPTAMLEVYQRCFQGPLSVLCVGMSDDPIGLDSPLSLSLSLFLLFPGRSFCFNSQIYCYEAI